MKQERDNLSKLVEGFSTDSDSNKPEIIEAFTAFLLSVQDYSEWTFGGGNAYGDRQVSYTEWPWGFCMEIVYTSAFIQAYNGGGDSWQPVYIQLLGERAKPLLAALNACLMGVFFGGDA